MEPSPRSPLELGGDDRSQAAAGASRSVGLISGLLYPLRGARLVFRDHPELKRYWVPPLTIAAIAMVAAIWLVLDHRSEWIAMVWPIAPTQGGIVGTLLRASYWVVGWVVTFVALGLGLVAAMFSAQVVGAPFHDALSEAVELIQSGEKPRATTLGALLRDAMRSVQLAFLKLLVFAGLLIPLWLLSLTVPVVGPVLYVGLGFALTIAFLALDHTDWAATRHGLSVRERVALLRAHPGAMLAFGTCAWFMLFIPVVNLLLTPAAVAGGTLLFLDLRRARVPA